MLMNTEPKLALRQNPANPNHHLWNNHGTWWCHLTLHLPEYQKQRFRLSLGTRNVTEARQIRDTLLLLLGMPRLNHPTKTH